MLLIIGVLSGSLAITIYIAINLSEKLKVSQKKEADLNIQIANFAGLESHFEQMLEQREIHFKQNIAEVKQQFTNQIRELKADYETRLSRKKEDEDKLRESFSNIANQILEQKNKNLQEQSAQNLQNILKPFQADITNFKQ